MNDRGLRSQRVLRIADGGEVFILDPDGVDCLFGDLPCLGGDGGNLFTDEPYALTCQQGNVLQALSHSNLRDIPSGQHRKNAGNPPCA